MTKRRKPPEGVLELPFMPPRVPKPEAKAQSSKRPKLTEVQKRDRVLDGLQSYRADLIAEARSIAVKLARKYGEVTSPQVVDELRAGRWAAVLDTVDLRFMGAVFRSGWARVRWITGKASPGSHARPVAVWRLE